MDQFIRSENIKLYLRLLSQSPPDEQRRVLVALLRCLTDQELAAQPSLH